MHISKLIMAAGLASSLMIVSGLTFAEQAAAPGNMPGDAQATTQMETQQPAGGAQGSTATTPDMNATQAQMGEGMQQAPAAAGDSGQDKSGMQKDNTATTDAGTAKSGSSY